MDQQSKHPENPEGGSSEGFWVTAKAWWEGATKDDGSVERNLAFLKGFRWAVILWIWSIGGAVAIVVLVVVVVGGHSGHAWSTVGVGAGVVSVLAALGIRLHRRRRRH